MGKVLIVEKRKMFTMLRMSFIDIMVANASALNIVNIF